jgi:hypothetical protein
MFQFVLWYLHYVQKYRVYVLGTVLTVYLLYTLVPPLLHDVLGVWRTDGARCEKDSNCLSQFCRHPELTPERAYCSSHCGGDGHCAEGMRCAQTQTGWECVGKEQRRYGKLCGEDAECDSGRCVKLSALNGKWLPPTAQQAPDFGAAFCVVSCAADAESCPFGDSCVQLTVRGAVCIPQYSVEQAAFEAHDAARAKKQRR